MTMYNIFTMDLLIDLSFFKSFSDMNYKQDLALKYGTPPVGVPPPPPPITIHKTMAWIFLFSLLALIYMVYAKMDRSSIILPIYVMIPSFIIWQYKRFERSKQKIYEGVYNAQKNVTPVKIE